MHGGNQAPMVRLDTSMPQVFHEMSRKGLGMTCVVDDRGRLEGIITDGDLRRHMERDAARLLDGVAGDVMTRTPVTVRREMLAAEALNILEQRRITSIVVVDSARTVQGVVHLHDLWRTEMV
jgi:arabinose-5-phosphate isomerase